ncbi:MAG: DUF3486 family protein [Caenispirillum sp.]|nr:DUF3486 family protein [Caenispirillum sp.]
MAPKPKIETELGEKDLAEFRRLLATGRLTIDGLTLWLEGRGYQISRSAVGRYAQNFEEVAAKLRQSRQVTDALVAELGDAAAQGKQGRLLVEMGRTLVFDLMMKLHSAEDGETIDTKDVQQLGKGIAELAKALRYDQDFEIKVREEVRRQEQAKAAKVATGVAKEAGLSDEMANAIARKILGAQA